MSTKTETKKLELVRVGNSTAAILPDEVLAWLHLKPGDDLVWCKRHEGIVICSSDQEFNRQMKTAREIMEEDREALRQLSKL